MSDSEEILVFLKRVLGQPYGGPSLSFYNGYFYIYRWRDAPVEIEELACGETLESLIEDYKERQENNGRIFS